MTDTTEGVVETTANETPIEQNPETKAAEEPAKSPDDELRKLQNALARRERRIGQLTAQKYQYQRELETFRQQTTGNQQPQKASPSGRPTMDSFETHEEYVEAIAEYKARQLLSENAKKEVEQKASIQKQEWLEEREAVAAEVATKAAETFSDYNHVLLENQRLLDALPEEIQEAFLEAENGPMAFYALAKEGKLESLYDMTPRQAAMEIARAEIRAQSLTKAKPVTKAPAPISSVKGSGISQKSVDDMSGKELLSHYGIG